jgi:hypothetical protein
MDTWKHGRYIDLWSFVHLLSGSLLCILLSSLGLRFLLALALVTALLCLWEVYEWLLKILEVPTNVATDLLIGMAGFLLAAYWHYFLGNPFPIGIVLSLGIVTALLSLWGFSDMLRKGYR